MLDGRLSGSAAVLRYEGAARKRVSVRWARATLVGVGLAAIVAVGAPTASAQPGETLNVCRALKVRGITPEVVQDIKQRMTNMGYSTQDTAASIDAMCPELWPQIIAAGW